MKSIGGKVLGVAAVFIAGMLVGVFTHYTLHRLILSSEPFIYVIF